MSSIKTAEFGNALGARIRHARIAARLSQTALGDALGISFQQIQKYEIGKDRVSAEALARIAAEVDRPVAEFFEEGPQVVGLTVKAAREGVRVSVAIGHLEPEVRRRVLALVEALTAAATGGLAPVTEPAPEPLAA